MARRTSLLNSKEKLPSGFHDFLEAGYFLCLFCVKKCLTMCCPHLVVTTLGRDHIRSLSDCHCTAVLCPLFMRDARAAPIHFRRKLVLCLSLSVISLKQLDIFNKKSQLSLAILSVSWYIYIVNLYSNQYKGVYIL